MSEQTKYSERLLLSNNDLMGRLGEIKDTLEVIVENISKKNR